MVLGDGEGGLELVGGLDHGGDETGGDVPFDVAVEEPDAWREETDVSGVMKELRGIGRMMMMMMMMMGRWVQESKGKGGQVRLIRIIGSEAQDNIPHWPYHEGIPSHGHHRERLIGNIHPGILL